MTKHFALIACSNGFGHARRTLALALELLRRGHNVTWFGQAEAFAHFKFHFDFLDQQNGKLTVLPLVTNTSAAALRQAPSDAMNWYRQLPSLASYDGVLSDNLLEVLYLRSDAIISGHFLWSMALADLPPEIAAQENLLLAKYQPPILSGAPFTFPQLKAYRGLIESGLSSFTKVGFTKSAQSNQNSQRNLLISSGKGGELSHAVQCFVETLKQKRPTEFDCAYVEPHALSAETMRPWLQPADFSPSMYKNIAAAICRPGIGTVTDSLEAGARVFAVAEPQNLEVSHNSSCMQNLNIGEACPSFERALQSAQRFLSDAGARRQQQAAIAAHINFTGQITAADLLEQRC